MMLPAVRISLDPDHIDFTDMLWRHINCRIIIIIIIIIIATTSQAMPAMSSSWKLKDCHHSAT